MLRHTYASVLAAGGERRDVIEQLMGHAARGTTSLYAHLSRDAFEGVEEALAAVFDEVASVPRRQTESSVTTGPDPAGEPPLDAGISLQAAAGGHVGL